MTEQDASYIRWADAREVLTRVAWKCACCGLDDPSGPSALIWRTEGYWDALCDVCARWIMRAAAKFIRSGLDDPQEPA